MVSQDGDLVPSRPITVAIDPIALVINECITVTSAMRKHTRWAHSSVTAILGGSSARPASADGKTNGQANGDDNLLTGRWGLRGRKGASIQDNPLLSAFARLRSDLRMCKNIRTFDTPAILQPFMQVIRSSSTTAPITSLALIAITKMLTYNVISPESPDFASGMQLLSGTVTHCRFEAENTATDEVVFLRILKLMEIMITGPAGETLGDQSVCEMMECGLSLCCHLRTTEVLRRSAEISMVTMCQTIFQRLRTLDLETEGTLEESTDTEKEELKIDSKVDDSAVGTQSPKDRMSASLDIQSSAATKVETLEEIKPYSLPSIRELFRVLSDLLDPFDKQHTDTMRVMALRIVNVALEISGPSISLQPSLAKIAKDSLCRNLFQLVRSENVAILHESLKVAGTLLATCRQVLKLQQELYLSYVVACLHPKVSIPDEPTIDPSLYEGVPQAPKVVKAGNASGRSTPVPIKDRQKLGLEGGSRKPDARESMVESVGALVRIPSFMVELFINYDCEIDRTDLCLDMVGLLSRNAFPDSATWSTTNVPPLCLDSLLSYIQFIADRLDEEATATGYPDPAALREKRSLKKVIIKGAAKFNESPKGGIAFLASQGIIENPDDPLSVVKFLRGTTRIDKKVLGEYISKKSSGTILDAFMDTFDFTDQRVDEALRQLLNTFRLPGESQLIERIVTEFSDRYCTNAPPDGIADKDAVYVLTYAIIMLNTDQHNPNVKSANRMQYQDFARNLRGVNGGKDFEAAYLQDIYDSIKTREIIMPEEHDNQHAFESAWKELLVKTSTATDNILCDTNVFDADMFAATWRPVIATLNYVFMSATDDTVFQRVITGFDQCARIAAKYNLPECLDHIITSLCKISTLATSSPPSTALNTEVKAGGKSIMVSKFAVDFGRENKAELATLVLFRIINGHENIIRDGWTPVLRIILNLFANSLVTISNSFDLQPIPLQSPAQVVARNDRSNDVGLFSAFTSYVSSVMNDEPPEPNEQEIEATLLTVDCINECRIDEVLQNMRSLSSGAMTAVIQALLTMVPEDASPRVIAVKPEVPAPTPIRPNGVKVTGTYDPSFVCLAELATMLVTKDAAALEANGKVVADMLSAAVRDANHHHPLAVGRLSYYLLRLLKVSGEHDFLRSPVVLHHISSLKQDVLKQSAQLVLKGLYECMQGDAGLRNEMTASPDFWSLLHGLREFPDGAPLAARVIEDVISKGSVTADNFEPTVALLNAFANAGAEQTMKERKQGQAQPQARQVKPVERPARSDVVVRGVKSMQLIQNVAQKVPFMVQQSHLEKQQAWQAYWQPIFRVLGMQCLNPCRDIRQAAFASLQRCLLADGLASDTHMEWTAIFNGVLFPLIQELLKEQNLLDRAGAVEMRIQASQLLCKTLLHYVNLLYNNWDGIVPLWKDILAAIERLMKSGGRGELQEAAQESLKNVLLVMASGEYLAPPPGPGPPDSEKQPIDDRTEQQMAMWAVTAEVLGRSAPDLLKEVFENRDAGLPILSPRLGAGAAGSGLPLRVVGQAQNEAKPATPEILSVETKEKTGHGDSGAQGAGLGVEGAPA